MVVRKGNFKENKKALSFDPNKSYKWEPEDEFVFSGSEFSFLYKTLQQEAIRANSILQSFNILQATFEKGIENGVIKEVEEQKDQPEPEIKEFSRDEQTIDLSKPNEERLD